MPAFAFGALWLACTIALTQAHGLSPACESLDAPPGLTASPNLDLSSLEVPYILNGLLKEPWSPPRSLLESSERFVRVDVMPLNCSEAPLKMPDGTLIGPASVPFAMSQVLPMLRRRAEERGFHAYVRHLPLDSFPEVSQQLPITRALRLAGSRLQSVNLWIGDGGMRSNLHWDGHDNILLQLAGTKTLLLLPPEATPLVSYIPFAEHKYLFRGDSFAGYTPTNVTVENHALFDAFNSACTEMRLPAHVLARARVATLRPGEALFLPALWSHAVVSTPAQTDAEGAEAAGLNMAVNIWFTQLSVSHKAALEAYPEWSQGWFVYGNDLRAAGRHAEAVDAYQRAVQLRPDYFDAAHNMASALEAQHEYAAAEAQYRAAHALRPADTRCLGNLGVVLRREGRVDEAAACYERAIMLQPAEARGYALLGNVRALQERLEEADEALARALQLDVTDAKSFNSHGVVLEQVALRLAACMRA